MNYFPQQQQKIRTAKSPKNAQLPSFLDSSSRQWTAAGRITF